MKKIALTLTVLLSLPGAAGGESAFDILYGKKEKYKNIPVEEVISVDTFIVRIENNPTRVKLIGLRGPGEPPREKPERTHNGEFGFIMGRGEEAANPVVPVETQALDFVKNFLEGKRVRLEFDVNQISDDNKTLAYAYLMEDGAFVNEAILTAGYATLSIRPPNTKYSKILRTAYRLAREERRGIHNQ